MLYSITCVHQLHHQEHFLYLYHRGESCLQVSLLHPKKTKQNRRILECLTYEITLSTTQPEEIRFYTYIPMDTEKRREIKEREGKKIYNKARRNTTQEAREREMRETREITQLDERRHVHGEEERERGRVRRCQRGR